MAVCLRGWVRGGLLVGSLLMLLGAVPGATQLVREVVSLVGQDDCCKHACDSEECCPGQCLDCRYCGHANALTPAVIRLATASEIRLNRAFASADLHPLAYVSPPARPPAA